jgi:hypothetical protein
MLLAVALFIGLILLALLCHPPFPLSILLLQAAAVAAVVKQVQIAAVAARVATFQAYREKTLVAEHPQLLLLALLKELRTLSRSALAALAVAIYQLEIAGLRETTLHLLQ